MSIEMRRARNRQMLIFMLVCVGMLVLLSRLYYWQVLPAPGGHNLAQLANAEHTQNEVLNAPRGLIYDAQGHILATNVVRDDVYVEPIQFATDFADTFDRDLASLIQKLHSVLPNVSEDFLNKVFHSSVQTQRIAIRIDPGQSEKLHSMHLPDTFLEPRTWRVYPGGDLAAQVLGYVNGGENKGYYGIEGQYNTLLAGKPGSFITETDLSGNPLVVGNSAEQPAVNGADLTLTINSAIQYQVQVALAAKVQELHAQSGTALVLNARTGEIVAMAGAPTFDPNHYSDAYNTKGCLGQESVYFNPALYCSYEPGSTMKAVTMAAALDQGLITPDTSFNDPGYIKFNDADIIHNWAGLSYGTETMTQVLIHSANVGAAWVAHEKLGKDRYYPYLTKFGFGKVTGIADGPEYSGFYRTPSSADWSISDLTRQAFGQSIQATPLQLAMAYEAIANDGKMMRPCLIHSIANNGQIMTTPFQVEQQVISASAAHQLTTMLTRAAIDGSAQKALVPGYTIAAKTGTATTQGLASDETEASVAGFIPASNPQFVILVKIDRPQDIIYGGTAAAPLWKLIAEQLMWYYHVPPDAVS
ncbi:MAG: penicillin-binding protein 2 [Chloroflexota bacterium]|nr:penicillin-binding protein 2 [Chloroflexota bacterium]